MLFKVINGLTKVLIDHYRPLTVSSTKSFHGHNLLLASYLPAELMHVYKYSFPETIYHVLKIDSYLLRQAVTSTSTSVHTFKTFLWY